MLPIKLRPPAVRLDLKPPSSGVFLLQHAVPHLYYQSLISYFAAGNISVGFGPINTFQPTIELTSCPWARYPEKTDLLMLADRPPLLDTPLHHFLSDLTPNDAYFVRWHYARFTQHRPAYVSAPVARAVTRPLKFSESN